MAPESRACWSPHINTPTDLAGELDELAKAQSPIRESNAGSNKVLIEASTPLKVSTPPLVLPSTENLFTRFLKVLIETIEV